MDKQRAVIVLEVLGVLVLAYAGCYVYPALGLAVLGIGLVMFALALERMP